MRDYCWIMRRWIWLLTTDPSPFLQQGKLLPHPPKIFALMLNEVESEEQLCPSMKLSANCRSTDSRQVYQQFLFDWRPTVHQQRMMCLSPVSELLVTNTVGVTLFIPVTVPGT